MVKNIALCLFYHCKGHHNFFCIHLTFFKHWQLPLNQVFYKFTNICYYFSQMFPRCYHLHVDPNMLHLQLKAKVVRIHSTLLACKIEERVMLVWHWLLNIPPWFCYWVISKISINMVLALGPF